LAANLRTPSELAATRVVNPRRQNSSDSDAAFAAPATINSAGNRTGTAPVRRPSASPRSPDSIREASGSSSDRGSMSDHRVRMFRRRVRTSLQCIE
jgi:hypothetical protein